jgi:hypothetical protein
VFATSNSDSYEQRNRFGLAMPHPCFDRRSDAFSHPMRDAWADTPENVPTDARAEAFYSTRQPVSKTTCAPPPRITRPDYKPIAA